MKRLFAAALVAGGMLAGTVSAAGAVTFTYSTSGPYTGSVTGILGLTVDTQIYDIAFLYGSYNAVYPTGAVFANAAAIIDAINPELNIQPNGTGLNIARPSGIPVGFKVPISQSITDVSFYGSGVDPITGLWRRQIYPPGPFTINKASVETMWAQVTPVPIPAALPLLMSALGLFGFMGWRRKRMATA